MVHIPEDVREPLGAFCAKGVSCFLTAIITTFKEIGDEHSGTGLILSDEEGNRYCLTANHVVTPESRTPPRHAQVIMHSYVEDLAHAEFSRPLPPFKLRRSYYKSEDCDIAMLESSINGVKRAEFFRQQYYPISKLLECGTGYNALLEDVFVICGLPDDLRTRIAATQETTHRLLVHFFTGTEGASHSLSTRYTLKYASGNVSPGGMSGSPIWLVRAASDLSRPLDIAQIGYCIEQGKPLKLNITFAGLVVSHDRSAERLQAVRPEVCAEFAAKALKTLPSLRDRLEDDQIAKNFDIWFERHESEFNKSRLPGTG